MGTHHAGAMTFDIHKVASLNPYSSFEIHYRPFIAITFRRCMGVLEAHKSRGDIECDESYRV
jgi:hypothetical protein